MPSKQELQNALQDLTFDNLRLSEENEKLKARIKKLNKKLRAFNRPLSKEEIKSIQPELAAFSVRHMLKRIESSRTECTSHQNYKTGSITQQKANEKCSSRLEMN